MEGGGGLSSLFGTQTDEAERQLACYHALTERQGHLDRVLEVLVRKGLEEGSGSVREGLAEHVDGGDDEDDKHVRETDPDEQLVRQRLRLLTCARQWERRSAAVAANGGAGEGEADVRAHKVTTRHAVPGEQKDQMPSRGARP